ncbi:hypothetical protein BVN1_17530, partial [Bacillus velezensis]
ADAPSI